MTGITPYISRPRLAAQWFAQAALTAPESRPKSLFELTVPSPAVRVIRSENGLMPAKPPLNIVLCSPRGFCAGVVRAIDTVERALTIYGGPVYVRHEIVHNKYVVDSLKTKGAIFVEELAEIPDNPNAPVVFSAHGVPKSVPADAKARNFFSLDATCPLVTKV